LGAFAHILEVRMPIFYACDSEEQAKYLCAKVGGQYTGRSALYSGKYIWQAHTGTCVASFAQSNGTEFNRVMVVYNSQHEVYEFITIAGEAAAIDPFVIGGRGDASDELRSKYANYLRERVEARSKENSMHLARSKSNGTARLRRIKGKTVTVIAGTTIKHGTTGRVVRTGFGAKGDPRVGLEDVEGKLHWIGLSNVREVQNLSLFERAS
jgi:hypothetical protein